MIEHLYKVIRPHDFAGWADAARQYHQDNQAVQNIRDIHGDMPRKPPQKKTAGFTVAELAKILKVKMPLLDPDAMDTRANRNRSGNRNRTRGRASATAPKDVEEQRKTGHCFTCNKQGHISRNCPDKPADNKPTTQKKNTKARQAAITDDETTDEDEIDYGMLRHGRDIHPTWVKSSIETLSNTRVLGFCSTRAKSEEDFDSY